MICEETSGLLPLKDTFRIPLTNTTVESASHSAQLTTPRILRGEDQPVLLRYMRLEIATWSRKMKDFSEM
jgi:hypothetical protein